ncbi:hypothetical protein M5X17_31095 [Paenibacillus alvei]|uniref:hypothetical protein n=1 Tax=Paenibacillus alvei TaxID=44250 RepID=UPI00227F357A|nr:hypothetical protein [Paenibacillus alvei]MCY9738140.1 hypothetical protein [Paenibacillus alvei]
MFKLKKIRYTALDILSRHPEGLRKADLIDRVKAELLKTNGQSVSSALWNLDEKFPEYVRKEKKSRVNVIVYPTEELLKVQKTANSIENWKMGQLFYVKPTCDCSNELTLTIHQMHSMDYRVSSTGKIVKSSMKLHSETHLQEFSCTSCGNTYEVKLDNEKRYVRGEITREGFD